MLMRRLQSHVISCSCVFHIFFLFIQLLLLLLLLALVPILVYKMFMTATLLKYQLELHYTTNGRYCAQYPGQCMGFIFFWGVSCCLFAILLLLLVCQGIIVYIRFLQQNAYLYSKDILFFAYLFVSLCDQTQRLFPSFVYVLCYCILLTIPICKHRKRAILFTFLVILLFYGCVLIEQSIIIL